METKCASEPALLSLEIKPNSQGMRSIKSLTVVKHTNIVTTHGIQMLFILSPLVRSHIVRTNHSGNL